MKKAPIFVLLFFLFISGLLLFFQTTAPLRFVQGAIGRVFSVPQEIVLEFKERYFHRDEELSRLRVENQQLVEKLVEMEEMREENAALKSQFLEKDTDASTLLPATVVSYVGATMRPRLFVINKGSEHGVRRGATVVSGKTLVGYVYRTGEYSSQVILPFHEDFQLLAQTLDENIPGIAVGRDGRVVFDKVLTTDPLSQGDVVVTQGEDRDGGIYVPEGLVIGRVSTVNKEPEAPFQSGRVDSTLDFEHLRYVFVMPL